MRFAEDFSLLVRFSPCLGRGKNVHEETQTRSKRFQFSFDSPLRGVKTSRIISHTFMSETDIVKTIATMITNEVEPLGFRRSKQRLWTSKSDVMIKAIELDRSRWGGRFYLDFGILILPIHPEGFTQVPACDVYGRIRGLVPNTSGKLSIFDIENGWGKSCDDTMDYFLKKALPILSSIRTRTDLQIFIKECKPANFLIRGEAIDWLDRQN